MTFFFLIKDPMAVIKSLKKIYMLKSVAIPEYCLGGNVEFLGESRKNHGLGLALSTKTYIQNVIPKFEFLIDKVFKPIKTPIEIGYILRSLGMALDGSVIMLEYNMSVVLNTTVLFQVF
jgi:hypothetical protein